MQAVARETMAMSHLEASVILASSKSGIGLMVGRTRPSDQASRSEWRTGMMLWPGST